MGMDFEAARENLRNMSREALLEEIARHPDDFVPAARMLLEEEAARRGISPAEIEEVRSGRRGGDAPDRTRVTDCRQKSLVPVSTFDLGWFAEQARVLLSQQGIESFVRRTDHSLSRSAANKPGDISLYVYEDDVPRAAEILDDFLPASPDRDNIPRETEEQY